jgi:hypothetical protein
MSKAGNFGAMICPLLVVFFGGGAMGETNASFGLVRWISVEVGVAAALLSTMQLPVSCEDDETVANFFDV